MIKRYKPNHKCSNHENNSNSKKNCKTGFQIMNQWDITHNYDMKIFGSKIKSGKDHETKGRKKNLN